MAEYLVFRVREQRRHTSRSRLFLLLVIALIAVAASPVERTQIKTAQAVSASPSLVCSGSVCTWTFPYTGDYYNWTVPAGVTQVGFDVYGAQGGDGGPSAGGTGSVAQGGKGGRVQGKLSVTSGAVLRIYVGGKGTNYSLTGAGGFNGGGSTSATSDDNRRPGAGGGASDIRTDAALSTRLVVAGGGGGSSGWMAAQGGAGGGLIGGDAPGPYWCTFGGKGGTQSGGGAAGNCGNQAGSLGIGGNGRGGSHGGGGGGGGYYGGGGGTIDGGGGGSSFTHATLATEITHTQGSQTGNGLVVLTMLKPAVSSFAATVTSPSNQATQLTYNLQFSESVTGLLQSEISLSGTSTGWSVTSFTGSGASYAVGLTGTNVTSGTVVLTVAQDAVTSSITSQTGPSAATTSSLMTIDLDAPTASLTSSPSSPAAGMSLSFGMSFSESVSGIDAADFSNVGSALGCVFSPSAASGASVTVTVTQCQEGTLQLQLAANSVSDAATNQGPTSALLSSVIALQASPLTITAGAKSINYGGSWTDSYSQSGLIGSDTISSVSYSYSGTTSLGTSYGPSTTKPTAGGTYTITPTAVLNVANSNRYSLTYVSGSLTIDRVAQGALTITTTSGTYGTALSLATSGGSGTGVVSYVVASGSCSVNGNSLTLGDAGSSCSVVATKAADDNYNVVSSSATSISTAKATQATLTFSSTTATYGEGLVLGVTGGSGAGSVSYSVVSGTCSIVGALLTPGNAGSSCVIKATKATDTNYLERSSADTTITIAKAAQSVLTVSTTSATYGAVLSLATSGGSGVGSVSYSVVSGTCSVSGSSLTPGDAGSSCSVVATKAGDENYNSVTSSATSISTAKASQSTISIATTTTAYGQGLVLGILGGSGSGAVSYSVVSGTCSIVGALLSPGNAGSSCVIKATKATDTNYLERSSTNTTISITKASQTGLSVTSSASFTAGDSLSLTATGGQSSGSLSWSLNSGICSLSGSTLTASRGGITCVVEVTRAGDSNYYADSVTQTVAVDKIVQVLTFRSTPPSSPVVGGTYTVQVDSDASLAANVVIANQSSSVCSISAGVVTFNAVGVCLVSASQSGNDVYAAAAASQSITVGVVSTTTVPPAPSSSGSNTDVSTTTIPQSQVPAPVSTTSTTSTSTTTTTTTTTTTLPADPGSPYLANGEAPTLEAGEATAVVRGQKVKVLTKTENGQMIMTLPGNVILRIGTTNSASGEAQVGADGVLRMYGNTDLSVSVIGFVPKTTYTVFMFSDPVELGRGETSAKGTVNELVLVPNDVETGEHTLQVNGVGPGDEVISVSMGFEVMERQSNTRLAVLVISLAIALALLGGRPIFKRRRGRA